MEKKAAKDTVVRNKDLFRVKPALFTLPRSHQKTAQRGRVKGKRRGRQTEEKKKAAIFVIAFLAGAERKAVGESLGKFKQP